MVETMTRRSLGMSVVVILALSSWVGAQTQVVPIGAQAVQTIEPKDSTEGKTFLFTVSLPEAPPRAEFMSAVLELVVDAWSVLPADLSGGAVTLEIAPLARSWSGGALRAADLRATTMKRTVPVGSDRRVRIDVTEFVHYVQAHPTENYGLAVGSLCGSRSGRFDLEADGMGSGVTAKLTLYYKPVDDPVLEPTPR
jgi:hypothetical protein